MPEYFCFCWQRVGNERNGREREAFSVGNNMNKNNNPKRPWIISRIINTDKWLE